MGDGESMDFLQTSKTAPVIHVVRDGAGRSDEGTPGQEEVRGFKVWFRERRPFNRRWENFGSWNDGQFLWLDGWETTALEECT